MCLSLLLAFAALRIGLEMRRRRMLGSARSSDAIVRHMRRGKRALLMLAMAFALGPISAFFLRNWRPFGSFHAFLALLCALLFAATGWLGLRLESRRSAAVDLHGWLGLLAALAAAAASIAGFVLLP